MTNDLIKTSDLIDSNVLTPGHKEIGVIEDIAIDKDSGRVAYVVLKTNSFLGFDEKKFPIPLGAFYTDTNQSKKVILDVDKERLENAPVIDLEDLKDFNFTTFVLLVNEYYGVKPYLTDYREEMDMDRSGSAVTNPVTIEQARLKNNKFDNHHSRSHDRHSTHLG